MNNGNSSRTGGSILLVEDDLNIAKLFHHNLTKAGFSCEMAHNGRQGFEAAQRNQPDLIISDIMMPEVDGFEFRKLLLEDEILKAIPFVFLTAKGEEDDILQGYELEIEDYLIKTSSPKVIIAKVSAILKSLEKERGKVVEEVQKAADNMGAKVVPDAAPDLDGFDIKHWHVPFKNIPGGDFIDYIELDEDNLAIILGDVMGKRWGAWYFAVAYAGYVRSAVRIILESSKEITPSVILQQVNESVFKDERISEVFITLSIILLNKKTKVAMYGGAGDLPLIYKGEDVQIIKSDGVLLGFGQYGDYKDVKVDMKKGDRLFLLTDGIIESRNSAGEMFTQQGLMDVINEMGSDDDSIKIIKDKFIEFTGDEFEDDVSLISVKAL